MSDQITAEERRFTHRWITTAKPNSEGMIPVALELPSRDRYTILITHREALELIRDLSDALEEALYGD